MPVDIPSLRRKVEAGEVLSDDELRALDAHGRFEARLIRAHALLNADHDAEALRVLEALARERPRDPEVLLASARAQFAVERYGDAERSARALLTVNEGDPEALKLLAVIALRRGEHARAKEWVRQALERDPVDAEARLLREELDAASVMSPVAVADALQRERGADDRRPSTGSSVSAGPAAALDEALAPAPSDAFRKALRAELRGRRIPYDVREQEVVVATGPRGSPPVRAALASLWAAHGANPDPAEAARRAVDELLRTGGMPATAEALLAAVLPVLRPREFATQAEGSAHADGPAGLLVYLVLPDPEFVRHVPDRILEALHVDPAAAIEAAWRNLERSVAPIVPVSVRDGALAAADGGPHLWAAASGDGHDAARLLTTPQRVALVAVTGDAPLRVDLGRRELVIVCRESDGDAVRALETLTPARDGIRGRFLLDASGLTRQP